MFDISFAKLHQQANVVLGGATGYSEGVVTTYTQAAVTSLAAAMIIADSA